MVTRSNCRAVRDPFPSHADAVQSQGCGGAGVAGLGAGGGAGEGRGVHTQSCHGIIYVHVKGVHSQSVMLQVWQGWELEAVLARGAGVRDASKDATGMAALRRIELAGDVADLVSPLGGMNFLSYLCYFRVVCVELSWRATSRTWSAPLAVRTLATPSPMFAGHAAR